MRMSLKPGAIVDRSSVMVGLLLRVGSGFCSVIEKILVVDRIHVWRTTSYYRQPAPSTNSIQYNTVAPSERESSPREYCNLLYCTVPVQVVLYILPAPVPGTSFSVNRYRSVASITSHVMYVNPCKDDHSMLTLQHLYSENLPVPSSTSRCFCWVPRL